MNQFTIPMALCDYVPVVLFLIIAIKLQRDLYNKMSKGAFALFASGTIYVFVAGFLKASWKLLYAAGICDFAVLNKMFFPTQSISFLLAGIGMVAMMTHKQGETAYAVAPAVFSGTMIFVVLMVIGLGMMDFSLAAIAKKQKKGSAIVLLVLSFIMELGMGYLSSKDFSVAWANWVAETINIIGMAFMLLAIQIMEKAGLKEMKL